MKYEDAEYADSRLRDSIVRDSKGEPAYIKGVRNSKVGLLTEFYTIDRGAWGGEGLKEALLKDMNLEPVPLGFCNEVLQCGYIVRMPMRKDWKQGLRPNNTLCVYGTSNVAKIHPIALRRTILGIYPSFEHCLEEVTNMGFMKAFSRNWSLVKGEAKIHVAYKAMGFAAEVTEHGFIKFRPEFSYLKDQFIRETKIENC